MYMIPLLSPCPSVPPLARLLSAVIRHIGHWASATSGNKSIKTIRSNGSALIMAFFLIFSKDFYSRSETHCNASLHSVYIFQSGVLSYCIDFIAGLLIIWLQHQITNGTRYTDVKPNRPHPPSELLMCLKLLSIRFYKGKQNKG